MPYRLEFGRSFRSEVRAILRGQLEAAANGLAASGSDPNAAIHNARKKIKRSRGLLRFLLKDDKKRRRRENARLRGIAGALSGVRDAAALVETAAILTPTDDPEASALLQLRHALIRRRDLLVAGNDTLTRRIAHASSDLSRAAGRSSRFKLPKSKRKVRKLILRGWVTTTRAALDIRKTCEVLGPDTPFHDLRKRSQDRWMQVMLLASLWPTGFRALKDQMKSLIDTLGHEHDLAVLEDLLDELIPLGLEQTHLKRVAPLISLTRLGLREDALKKADRLFDADPEREARTLARLLDGI